MTEKKITTGGCLCGDVRFEIRGPLRDVVNCHCSMCQKLHGSMGAHSKANKAQMTMLYDKGLAWYQSSAVARRGFCRTCGSSLFWDPVDDDNIGILAGSLDHPVDLRTMGHILWAKKPASTRSPMTCRNMPARQTAVSPTIINRLQSPFRRTECR